MKQVTLDDLICYDNMYYIGDLIDNDRDGWVFEDQAIEIIEIINNQK
jgi:hypothetical protein